MSDSDTTPPQRPRTPSPRPPAIVARPRPREISRPRAISRTRRQTPQGIRMPIQRSPAEQYRRRREQKRVNKSCVRNATGDLVELLTGRRCGLGKKTRKKKSTHKKKRRKIKKKKRKKRTRKRKKKKKKR